MIKNINRSGNVLDAILVPYRDAYKDKKQVVFYEVCREIDGELSEEEMITFKIKLFSYKFLKSNSNGDGKESFKITTAAIAYLVNGGYTKEFSDDWIEKKSKLKQLKSLKKG